MDPARRPKVEALLANPIFDHIRDAEREKMSVANFKLDLKMDKIKMKEGDLVDYSEDSLVRYVIKYS